jgi:3',5'-nucleoside bisphosphate phosphatase
VEKYIAELHVHTVLSPCADIEMLPFLIVRQALSKGINLLAITDHNTTANISAVQEAAAGENLTVLPGMELQTKEEVHLLCLFDTLEQAYTWQKRVDEALPAIENNVEHFGEQFVVDSRGEFIRREERLLITSTDITLKQAVEEVTALGGLAVPAHIERRAFSLLANLGFVPTDVHFEALELSQNTPIDEARRKFPQLKSYRLIQNGDAHFLSDILGLNELKLTKPSIKEIILGLNGFDGRSISNLPIVHT